MLLVILLLLFLRACGSGDNRHMTVNNNDSSSAPPAPLLAEKKKSSSLGPETTEPPAIVTPQSPEAGQTQGPAARTEPAETKVHAGSEKKLPAVAVAQLQKAPVAAPATEAPVVQQEAGQANVSEELAETFTEPITGIKFILVRGGCYPMGTDQEQVFEGPMHEVCVDDFYLSKYEVTQRQWLRLMGRTVSHFYFQGKSRPVEWVNWYDSQDFIRTLNRRSERTYRLPTEAEWEYAARSGGQNEKYAGTNDEESLEDFAWYRANSNGQTRFIGMKKPNGLGLHDMSGNVREWCSDWHGKDYYNYSPRENPQGPDNGEYRVIRGGAWGLPKGLARTTYRDAAKPNQRRNDIGFRLALPAK